MSWRCSAPTNEGLISNLWRHGLLATPRVREAMAKVDRAHFSRENPYEDSPQRIGYDATISGELLLNLSLISETVANLGSSSAYSC